MRARADAMIVQRTARANRADMRAGMHAAVTDTGACAHHRSGMAARGHAMAIHARACANTADMGARAHAMCADMGANTDTQHINIRAHGIGCDRHQKRGSKHRSGERFHRIIPLCIAATTVHCG